MNGREDKYQWAGPYLYSRQMVAVRKESEINTIQDLEGKGIAVQATRIFSFIRLRQIFHKWSR